MSPFNLRQIASNTISTICMSPTVLSKGHSGLFVDATLVAVGQTEYTDFLFKLKGTTAWSGRKDFTQHCGRGARR